MQITGKKLEVRYQGSVFRVRGKGMFKVFNVIEDVIDPEMKIAQGSIQLPVLSLCGLVFVTKCFD